MPYKLDWYIEGQVIYGELWGNQTLEELQTSNRDILQYLNSSDGRFIHAIMNDDKLGSIPVSLVELRKVLTYSKHQHLGWVVMTGDKKRDFKDHLFTMLAKITRARYLRLKTFDDAIAHLRKIDNTINWDAVNPNFDEELTNS